MENQRARAALMRAEAAFNTRIDDMKRQGMDKSETEAGGELSSFDQHSADHASELYEREKDLGLMLEAGVLLERIADAKDRLAKGDYGRCIECGAEIAPGRLEALPWAERCTRCEETSAAAHQRPRPLEEAVLAPPYGRMFTHDDNFEFDGEDAWQALAEWGNANGPQDVFGTPDSDGFFKETDEPVGSTGDVDQLVDVGGDGVTDWDAIYPDPDAKPGGH